MLAAAIYGSYLGSVMRMLMLASASVDALLWSLNYLHWNALPTSRWPTGLGPPTLPSLTTSRQGPSPGPAELPPAAQEPSTTHQWERISSGSPGPTGHYTGTASAHQAGTSPRGFKVPASHAGKPAPVLGLASSCRQESKTGRPQSQLYGDQTPPTRKLKYLK